MKFLVAGNDAEMLLLRKMIKENDHIISAEYATEGTHDGVPVYPTPFAIPEDCVDVIITFAPLEETKEVVAWGSSHKIPIVLRCPCASEEELLADFLEDLADYARITSLFLIKSGVRSVSDEELALEGAIFLSKKKTGLYEPV